MSDAAYMQRVYTHGLSDLKDPQGDLRMLRAVFAAAGMECTLDAGEHLISVQVTRFGSFESVFTLPTNLHGVDICYSSIASVDPSQEQDPARAGTSDSTTYFDSGSMRTLRSGLYVDGEIHPFSDVLRKLLPQDWGKSFVRSTWTALLEGNELSTAATLVRCLGAADRDLAGSTGLHIVKEASTRLDSLGLRSAGIYALESWGGPVATEALKAARGREHVTWLHEYIGRVIRGLEGTSRT